ncbi:MAG: hypothetical protein WAW41_15660 [Methylobacter sp.]
MIKKLFVSAILRMLFTSYFLDESCKQILQLGEMLPQELAKIQKKMNETRLK